MPLLPNDPPRAAYVHVPFCRHRCGYCNFTLVAGRDDLIEAYLQAIASELAGLSQTYQLDTLYLGGGTPTHLPAESLRRLIEMLFERFQLASGYELTVEANPLDLDAERCRVLAEFGVTRLSLGVQSFQEAKLQLLERDHRAADITHALAMARQTSPAVSLDLIYGTPGETLDQWRNDLDRAIATGVEHISVYGLTIEQGASFYGRVQRGALHPTAEPLQADMYELMLDRLADAGYEHYEISNFAQPSHRSRHNQVYWRGESYFAFGPGAARYVAGRREINHRSTTTYLKRVLAGESPVGESEELLPEDRARERLVFGLRMLDGLNPDDFICETGYSIDTLIGQQLPSLLDLGLLRWINSRLQLTRAGLLVSDSIWPQFL